MLGVGLGQIADIVSRFETRALVTHPRQCVRVRHRKAQCTRCADHCPTHAITWGESLQVDVDKCNDCGLCAAVCPTGALEAARPTNAELSQRIETLAKGTARITFACPRVTGGDAGGVVRVNCLGRLDASVLVDAAANGVQHIELVEGECAACPMRTGREVAALAVAEANALLEAFGHAARATFVDKPPAGGATARQPSAEAVSRRAFFSQLVHGTRQAAAVTTETILAANAAAEQAPVKRGELPTRVPAAKTQLVASLRRLGQPVSNGAIRTALWGNVRVEDDKCTGCQMCAFFCPAGALVKIEQDGKRGLAFKNAACTNCRMCAGICYQQAIVVSNEIDLRVVVEQATAVLWLGAETGTRQDKLKRLLGPVS